MTHKIFAIIPTHNEVTVLRQTVLNVLDQKIEVILVDDGSTDNSYQQVSDLPIHYLRHAIKLGQGAALQTGMEYALAKNVDFAIHFDADGQHDAAQIKDMISPLISGLFDVVLGSRFLRKSDTRKVPGIKMVVLKIGTVVNGLFTGLWLTDSHNGFRALNKKALNTIKLSENGMSHATEILSEIKRNNLRYCEVPTKIDYTAYSIKKGQRMSNGIHILVNLVINKIIK